MLRSQGWEPGQYLGAKDAAQSDRYTEANASHIRVVLKDDNLGLGAKQGGGDQCTGLDAFQHLLGRLNGKAEDVLEAELIAREDVKRSIYLERKIGTIRFVKGGWLVGDILKEEVEGEGSSKSDVEMTTSSAEETTKSEKSKKRKAERDAEEKPSKKDKKSKKRKTETEADSDSDEPKSKKRSSKKSKKQAAEEEDSDSDGATTSSVDKKSSRKEEKKARKRLRAEKREKKEARRKEKAGGSGAESSGDSISREKKRRKVGGDDEKEAAVLSVSVSGTSTPVGGSGTSTPISTMTSNRFLSRKRFIAQKTMAFGDAAAMNQVCAGLFLFGFCETLTD